MKYLNYICLLALLASLVISIIPWTIERDKAFVHTCYLNVVDESTGKPINVSVSTDFSSAAGRMEDGPQIVRMTPNGVIMISWASIGPSKRKFYLQASGYVKQEIPSKAVESTDGHVSIGGLDPFTIRMKSAQQGDAPEPATIADPASPTSQPPAR